MNDLKNGEGSIWQLVNVTLTLMEVHQLWKLKELLFFGTDQSISIT